MNRKENEIGIYGSARLFAGFMIPWSKPNENYMYDDEMENTFALPRRVDNSIFGLKWIERGVVKEQRRKGQETQSKKIHGMNTATKRM